MTATPQSYFEAMYAKDVDPWNLATSAYEARKYALTLASLPRGRYRRAFEPGCAIGVLTDRLAAFCDELVAWELLPKIARQAEARTARWPNVLVEAASIPEKWPTGRFDLIVLSEVVYYLSAADIARLVQRIEDALDEDGNVVCVHYRGETSYPLTGDEANEALCRVPFLQQRGRYEERDFRLDVLERRAP